MAQAGHGWALGLAGRKPEALTILGDLERQTNSNRTSVAVCWPVSASGWATMIEPSHGCKKLPRQRDGLMTFVNSLLVSDPLRSDPRFQAILKKMNFPAQT